VFYVESTDGGVGLKWRYLSEIQADHASWLSWTDSEGPCEPTVVLLPDARIMSVFRVDSREDLIQAFSKDGGSTWENISRMDAWAVMPQLQTLQNGVVVLTSGRPGLRMWLLPPGVSAQNRSGWQAIDLASEHNKGVEPAWQYKNWTVNATCVFSPSPCIHCAYPFSCTPPAVPPETTAYTGLAELTPISSTVSKLLVVYDRVANGWAYPPGRWGGADGIFSMVVTIDASTFE
jgi:hypothetical protein